MTRHESIALLLRCANDAPFAQPKSWSDVLRRNTRSGEGPSATITCEPCRGEGKRRIRGIEHICDQCKGRGKLVVDAYTLKLVSVDEQHIQHVKMLRCDTCGGEGVFRNEHRCGTCNGSGWVGVPLERLQAVRTPLSSDAPELGPGDPVLACLERRQIAGSFEELGLALACLRLDWPIRYRLLVDVYVAARREPEQLHLDEALTLERGLAYLDSLMPAEIRVPSWAARNERRRRDGLKRRAKEAAA